MKDSPLVLKAERLDPEKWIEVNYREIMELIDGGTLFGNPITTSSTEKELIVAAYFLGLSHRKILDNTSPATR